MGERRKQSSNQFVCPSTQPEPSSHSTTLGGGVFVVCSWRKRRSGGEAAHPGSQGYRLSPNLNPTLSLKTQVANLSEREKPRCAWVSSAPHSQRQGPQMEGAPSCVAEWTNSTPEGLDKGPRSGWDNCFCSFLYPWASEKSWGTPSAGHTQSAHWGSPRLA